MLATPDLHLVHRDRELDGLAWVLDPEIVASELRRTLRLNVTSVAPTYVRYKPGISCLVAYTVIVADGPAVHAYVKTYADALRPKFEKRTLIGARAGLANAWAVIERPPVTLGLFPLDAKLPALTSLASLNRTGLLQRLLPPQVPLSDARFRVLAYKPERRCVGQLLLRDVPYAAIKIYTPLDFARAHAAAATFDSISPRVARLVGQSRGHRVLALEWIDGARLDDIIRSGDHTDAPARTAAALAALHRLSARGLGHRYPDADCKKVREAADAVAWLCPALATDARHVAERAAAAIGTTKVTVPIHGDFYARQVVLERNGNIAILDLDEAAVGNPACDLATFIAHLERDAAAGRLSQGCVAGLSDAFLDAYQREIPWTVGLIDAEVACALLRLAPHFFRERDPEWPERIGTVVARARHILDGNTVRTRRSGTARQGAPQVADPALPTLALALDIEYAGRALAMATRRGADDSHRLVAARVIRHKPGRRCLIEYVSDGGDGRAPLALLGKIRRNGADHRTFAVQCQLRKCGFDEVSADGVSVPEPAGIISELHMWLQRRVEGNTATTPLLAGGDAALPRIARAIHKLHTSSIQPPRHHALKDELRILTERLGRVAESRPHWHKRLEDLAGKCERAAARLAPMRVVPVHRDFYPDHALIDGERLYLVDFDLCSWGDPALDAGNFIGHLLELAVRNPRLQSRLELAAAVFHDEFARLSGTQTAARIATYVTLTLARHVYISTQFPDREAYTEALLDLSERRLADAQSFAAAGA